MKVMRPAATTAKAQPTAIMIGRVFRFFVTVGLAGRKLAEGSVAALVLGVGGRRPAVVAEGVTEGEAGVWAGGAVFGAFATRLVFSISLGTFATGASSPYSPSLDPSGLSSGCISS